MNHRQAGGAFLALLWVPQAFAQGAAGTAAPASEPPATNQPTSGFETYLSQRGPDATFLFGRANYFRVLVKQRRCNLFDADRYNAANARFEAARARLAQRFSAISFAEDLPAGTRVRDGACTAAALMSYETHIAEVESFLGSGK
jgi:hypothetical protein